jgi:hypothetical protein
VPLQGMLEFTICEASRPARPRRTGRIMVAQQLRNRLGTGIFTVSEAALYARVAPQMVARWLFGSARGNAVVDPQYDPDERIVGFLDFVQTVAIREIRLQKKIPLPKFRQAIQTAKSVLNLNYPFARPHCTYYWPDQEIFIRKSADEPIIEASGRHRGQPVFQFVEMYLQNLGFDEDGLANLYRIFSTNEVTVMMNPRLRFGEPLLPSGYSAKTVWEGIQTEGGTLNRTAKVFGIPIEEVQASYRFFVDYLGKSAA